MTKKPKYPRLDNFLKSLEDALQDPVVQWFDQVRAASEVRFKSPVLRQCFLVGAVPEVFTLDEYDANDLRSNTCYTQKVEGAKWREKNPPAIVGTWWREFYFYKADGSATRYRLPLDRKIICDFANRVIARRKSFV